MRSIGEWLREDLAAVLGIDQALIREDLALSDLGLSSSQLKELIFRAEETFDTVIDETTVSELATVDELGALIAFAVDRHPVP